MIMSRIHTHVQLSMNGKVDFKKYVWKVLSNYSKIPHANMM